MDMLQIMKKKWGDGVLPLTPFFEWLITEIGEVSAYYVMTDVFSLAKIEAALNDRSGNVTAVIIDKRYISVAIPNEPAIVFDLKTMEYYNKCPPGSAQSFFDITQAYDDYLANTWLPNANAN